MGSFLWGPQRLVRTQRVRPDTRAFELRRRDGYPWGMVATAKLNRFRAYGFYCGRFEPRKVVSRPVAGSREHGVP